MFAVKGLTVCLCPKNALDVLVLILLVTAQHWVMHCLGQTHVTISSWNSVASDIRSPLPSLERGQLVGFSNRF